MDFVYRAQIIFIPSPRRTPITKRMLRPDHFFTQVKWRHGVTQVSSWSYRCSQGPNTYAIKKDTVSHRPAVAEIHLCFCNTPAIIRPNNRNVVRDHFLCGLCFLFHYFLEEVFLTASILQECRQIVHFSKYSHDAD